MKGKFFGAVLLVAGAAIGAGMLGMPIATGFAGFYPSLFIMILSWAFLLLSSFLMVDVNLSLEGEANIISMADKTLGRSGKVVSWVSFLFLLCALNVAFIAGGSKILNDVFPSMPTSILPILFVMPLAFIITSGMNAVDRMNRFLVIGKIGIGYGILVYFVPPHVNTELLTHADLLPLPFMLPIVLQAFGFHTVVPSLVNFLDRDVVKLRWALTVGSLIALVVYIIWEFLVLGVVPVTGEISLASTYMAGDVSTTPLIHLLEAPIISVGAIIFAFLAVATAFLGVSLGLFDFLLDGLKINRSEKNRYWVYALTFLPPLFFVYTSERIFFVALEYAGALVAIIFGLIPILMAWRLEEHSYWKTRTGKGILITGMVFFASAIFFDIFSKFGYLEPIVKTYLD